MNTMQLEIVDFSRKTYEGPIVSVTVPGAEGQLTILPHHIPLITPLKAGEVVIHQADGKDQYLAVSGGFLIVQHNRSTLLVDSAVHLDELDEQKILEAKARAEKALAEKQFADDRSFADASGLLEHSIAQMHLLQKRKKAHHSKSQN